MQALLAAIAIAVVHGHCVHCVRPYKLAEMQFVSRTSGWAVGSVDYVTDEHVSIYGTLLHTLDGGKHWREVPDVETYGIDTGPSFSFIDANVGWVSWPVASTAQDHLIRTRDGGRGRRNGPAPRYPPPHPVFPRPGGG